MKLRTYNHLLAVAIALTNILAFIAVLTGQHTVFGIVAVSISLAVGLGMYVRVMIATAAMEVSEKKDDLIRIAISQQKRPEVMEKFAEWVENNDMDFCGAQLVDLRKAMDGDKCLGFWLLAIGSRRAYERIKNEMRNCATVLDFWPLDEKQWAENIRLSMEIDPDLPKEEDDMEPLITLYKE